MTRRARLVVEPLADWPYPDRPTVPSPFTSHGEHVRWSVTRDELLREADHLGAATVVLEIDADRTQLRQDGEPRAGARLRTGRVRISMDTRHGPMRWALARYDRGELSWQANVRGIVLTLDALRAVERYGAVTDGQQYRGFLAIEATAAPTPTGGHDLDTADGAVAWLVARAETAGHRDAYRMSRGALLRAVAGELAADDVTDYERVRRTLGGAGSAT